MPPTSPIELAIMAFIIIGIIVVIFRAGRANPENTGTISKDVNALKSDVRKLESEFEQMRKSVGDMATKSDLARIETKLDGQRELVNVTAAGVRRLEDFFLEKGVNGK
jgi:outer membrane murein-binding lipoprotein Lpp